jgi:hypothetical protein
MAEKVEVDVYISMNEEGGYSVATEAEDAAQSCAEECGGNQLRTVKLVVTMTPPEQMPEAHVDVPDEAGETTTVTARAAT